LPIPGIASPGSANYDFQGNQWRIGWRGGRTYWARILAFVTGMMDQELLARNQYLAAESRILKVQANGRLKLTDAERATLGEIGHRLGRKRARSTTRVCEPNSDETGRSMNLSHSLPGALSLSAARLKR
jgi:hypothetical protein